jgi:hypothetical protein
MPAKAGIQYSAVPAICAALGLTVSTVFTGSPAFAGDDGMR